MPLATDGPFPGWDWHIVFDADMNEPLPQFLDGDDSPVDLTGLTLEIYVRPTFDHSTLLKKFSSAGLTPEITIDDADESLATVFLARADVQTAFSAPGEWDFFVLLKDGTEYAELARGPFYVHAGKT